MVEAIERRRAETGKGQSNKPLGVLVDTDTLNLAGFNYWEVSFSLPKEGGGRYLVHVSDQTREFGVSHPNIVIVEDLKRRGAVRWREWYFGTFEGAPRAERHGNEEDVEYFSQIRQVIQPSNRVSGFDLERLIEREIDKALGGAA